MKGVPNYIGFLTAGTVQGCGTNKMEVAGQIKFFQNTQGEHLRLGGRQHQRFALIPKPLQKRGDTIVNPILEQTSVSEVFPIGRYSLLGLLLRHSVKLHEGIQQGRANKTVQRRTVGLVDAKLVQRIHNTVGDTLAGFGKRAIQIKQIHLFLMHNVPSA